MAMRENDTLPQPFRWLTAAMPWAVSTAANRLKARASDAVAVSPVSSDWLLELQRRSVRTYDQ